MLVWAFTLDIEVPCSKRRELRTTLYPRYELLVVSHPLGIPGDDDRSLTVIISPRKSADVNTPARRRLLEPRHRPIVEYDGRRIKDPRSYELMRGGDKFISLGSQLEVLHVNSYMTCACRGYEVRCTQGVIPRGVDPRDMTNSNAEPALISEGGSD